MSVPSVYITTDDGGLSDVVVDGDVLIAKIDLLDTDWGFDLAEAKLERYAGAPAGLIDAVREALEELLEDSEDSDDYESLERRLPDPVPGRDRPWVLIVIDETPNVSASETVSVVVHDWNTWRSEHRYHGKQFPAAWEADRRREIDHLGPAGKTAGTELLEEFLDELALDV